MIIKLFELSNGIVIPTEHCYTIKWLKDLMDVFPGDYMCMYAYLHYMTCPNGDLNPFFNIKESDKEEVIYNSINGAKFSLEEPLLQVALEECVKLNQSSAYRAFLGIKVMLDNLSDYLQSPITAGRDGNGPFMLAAAEKLPKVKEAYNKAYEDMKREQISVRGGKDMSYDQRGQKMSDDDIFQESV